MWELNSSYLRNSQILNATDVTSSQPDILLPETQQHRPTGPFV